MGKINETIFCFPGSTMYNYMPGNTGRPDNVGRPPPVEDVPGHPVAIVGGNYKQRECRYCRFTGNRTKSGWRVKTNYKCATCDIPLCTKELTNRNCFTSYHHEFVFRDQQSELRVNKLYSVNILNSLLLL